MALYDPQQHRAHVALYQVDPGVPCLSFGAWTLWLLGYPDQALERMHQAVTLAEESLHPFSLAWALTFTAWVHHLRREGEAVQERAGAVIALCTEHGFPLFLAFGTAVWGWALAVQGQTEDGIEQIRRGLAALQATGGAIGRSYFLGMLAEAHGQAGQIEDGLATVAEALAFVEQTEERFYEAELHRLKGALTLQSQGAGQKSKVEGEAEAYFHKALDIARHQQARSLELRAATSLARLWQQQGKQTEAREVLSEIYNWFTEGFDTKDLQEVKALLEELA